jgi:hypothetical protein
MLRELMLHHHPQLLQHEWLELLRLQADQAYEKMNAIARSKQIPHVYALPDGGVFVKQVASFTLEAVLGYDQCLELLKNLAAIPALQIICLIAFI